MLDSLIHLHLLKSGLIDVHALKSMVITPLHGGTNQVFLVSGKPGQFVIKIPKPAAMALIDRKNEYHANTLTAAAGISLPFCYFDLESGINITRYHANSQNLTPALLQHEPISVAVADLLRTLHQLPSAFLRDIDIFAVIADYRLRIAGKLPLELADLPDWDPFISSLHQEFSTLNIPLVPCHNDLVLANFLVAPERIYLIDWEYSGNHDFCWDLASLASEAEFSPSQEQKFLENYFKNKVPKFIERRYQIYKILSDYLWTLWCIVMQDHDNTQSRWQRFKAKIP
jgi:thiamine kinase-like enzyme